MNSDKPTPPAPPAKEPKLPYAEPKLTTHGTVEEITGNIGTKGTDGLTGSSVV